MSTAPRSCSQPHWRHLGVCSRNSVPQILSHLRVPIRLSYEPIRSYRKRTMVATAMVQVRMDEKTKQQAAKVLAALGLSVSDAVRIFLAPSRRTKNCHLARRPPSTKRERPWRKYGR